MTLSPEQISSPIGWGAGGQWDGTNVYTFLDSTFDDLDEPSVRKLLELVATAVAVNGADSDVMPETAFSTHSRTRGAAQIAVEWRSDANALGAYVDVAWSDGDDEPTWGVGMVVIHGDPAAAAIVLWSFAQQVRHFALPIRKGDDMPLFTCLPMQSGVGAA